jgi:hypothetical protein
LEGQTCLLLGGAPDSPVHHRTDTVAVRCAISFLFWRIRLLVMGSVGAPDSVQCTPDSPVCPTDRCAGDRWLTRQSGAPPDSPMNFSHIAPLLFPRMTSSTRMTHRTVRCTTGQSGELKPYAAVESRERPLYADQLGAPDTIWCTTG